MPKRKPYEFKAKVAEADLYLYDDIGDSWDGTTAKGFAEELKGFSDTRVLNIYINSPGGSVFDGIAIFNQLRRMKAKKRVYIDGIAASIASVIAMVGDEIEIASNGFMMIHNPWAMAMGDAEEFRKMADQLDKVGESILGTYVDRTGGESEKIAEMMGEETWMSADEAVEMGFADRVGEEAKMAARFDLSKFAHPPADLAAKIDVAKNPPKLTLVKSHGSGSDDPAAGGGGGGSVSTDTVQLTSEQVRELIAAGVMLPGTPAEPAPPDIDEAELDARLAREERYLEKITA